MPRTFRVALIGPPLPGRQLPSLALAQLAAVVRGQGHELFLRDAAASGASLKATVDEIIAFQPDLLGLTASTPAVRSAGTVAAAVKRSLPDCLCVVGGPHASAVPRSTLEAEPAFDCAVIGEGEETLPEMLVRLGRRNFSGVRGVAWRKGGEVKIEERRPRIADLNLLPLPWWEGYPGYPEAYYAAAPGRRKPASYMVTSRGCSHRCSFCDRGVFGQDVSVFSADYILRAIDDMVRRFGVRDLSFEDDLFTAYHPRLRRVCEGLIEQRRDLTWECFARTETARREMYELMKQAGCRRVTFCVDSADERVRGLARTRTQPKDLALTIKAARRARLEVAGSFFIGLPGESDESIDRSIRFALDMPFDDIAVKFPIPFPGTEISDRLEEWGSQGECIGSCGTATPEFLPRGMTAEQLLRRRAEFHRRFHLRLRRLPRLLGRLISSPGATLRALRA